MRRPRLLLVLLALLAYACGGPQQGTQTGDEGDVSTPGVTCAPACKATETCCGKTCVDMATDPQSCGKCGNACPTDSYCVAGTCAKPACTASCAGGTLCCGEACCGAAQSCCASGDGPTCGALDCSAP